MATSVLLPPHGRPFSSTMSCDVGHEPTSTTDKVSIPASLASLSRVPLFCQPDHRPLLLLVVRLLLLLALIESIMVKQCDASPLQSKHKRDRGEGSDVSFSSGNEKMITGRRGTDVGETADGAGVSPSVAVSESKREKTLFSCAILSPLLCLWKLRLASLSFL